MENDEHFFCYADFYPPQPRSIVLAIQSKHREQISLVSQKFGRRTAAPPLSLKSVKKARLSRKFDL